MYVCVCLRFYWTFTSKALHFRELLAILLAAHIISDFLLLIFFFYKFLFIFLRYICFSMKIILQSYIQNGHLCLVKIISHITSYGYFFFFFFYWFPFLFSLPGFVSHKRNGQNKKRKEHENIFFLFFFRASHGNCAKLLIGYCYQRNLFVHKCSWSFIVLNGFFLFFFSFFLHWLMHSMKHRVVWFSFKTKPNQYLLSTSLFATTNTHTHTLTNENLYSSLTFSLHAISIRWPDTTKLISPRTYLNMPRNGIKKKTRKITLANQWWNTDRINDNKTYNQPDAVQTHTLQCLTFQWTRCATSTYNRWTK